jgi:hypothetical protein
MIKKVCFHYPFAQMSEENMMKNEQGGPCQEPAEECSNESGDIKDSRKEQNILHMLGDNGFWSISPRHSPTKLSPQKTTSPARSSTLRQNGRSRRQRVSFFVPYSSPMLDEIHHRNTPSRTTSLRREQRHTGAESTIFEFNRMESICTPPPDQPLTIPVRRCSPSTTSACLH